MSESILDIIGAPATTVPPPGDIDGDAAYSGTTGKFVGYLPIRSSLKGAWIGFGNGILSSDLLQLDPASTEPEDRTFRSYDIAMFFITVSETGNIVSRTFSTGPGGTIAAGAGNSSGRLLRVQGRFYNLINGDPESAGWGEILYPAIVAPDYGSLSVFLTDWTAARGSGGKTAETIFAENNVLYKVSSDPDFSNIQEAYDMCAQWVPAP